MAIELRDVVKTVDAETHIYPTNLSLKPGGFNILLGTTLSGKTTLLRLMAGLEVPSSGEIWFQGENVTRIPVQKRSVSMVYQQFINYPNFNVFDNIASPLRVAGIPAKQVRQRVHDIAGLLKLESFLKKYPAELSGGQQQRIAIARALVKNSKLVLLDEPLANLDYKLREELRDEMPKLFADSGATVVYSTTEPLEALMLGGHTATLHQGKVTQYQSTIEGYRLPDNLDSARVFSDPPINTAEIQKKQGRFFLNDEIHWAVPKGYSAIPDRSYTVAFRPHHLTLRQQLDNSIEVAARVKIAELSGSDSVIHIDVDGNSWVTETHGIHPFESGEKTPVFLAIDRCYYFDQDQQLLRPSHG